MGRRDDEPQADAAIAAIASAPPVPIDDAAGRVERLRRILARYGDRVPMAMCHRPDWQQEIDDALQFVANNPDVALHPNQPEKENE
jgi:hypothetical protein